MGKIINFNNNENGCLCVSCQLAKQFVDIVKDAETEDELFDILRELVEIAGNNAIRLYLSDEINAKMDLLEILEAVED